MIYFYVVIERCGWFFLMYNMAGYRSLGVGYYGDTFWVIFSVSSEYNHFLPVFWGFSHILRNPLSIAQNLKFHQIPSTISYIFPIIDYVSIAKFRCPKLLSKYSALRPFSHCVNITQNLPHSIEHPMNPWPSMLYIKKNLPHRSITT